MSASGYERGFATLCTDHGFDVEVSDEGDCVHCGHPAWGAGADKAHRVRQLAEVVREGDPASDKARQSPANPACHPNDLRRGRGEASARPRRVILQPACHPNEEVFAIYRDGAIHMSCIKCHEPICAVEVAAIDNLLSAARLWLQRAHDAGFTDIWYAHPGGDQHNRFGERWHAGMWTGPDHDLICVTECKTAEEAERCLSPGGDSPEHATLLALAKLAQLRGG